MPVVWRGERADLYDGIWRMTERIKQILDAVTDKVMAYRPVDKGQQAKKIERRVKRRRKKQD